MFSSNESVSKIKCCYGFNAVGLWDNMINNGILAVECLRCRDKETWEHVILCKEIRLARAKFIYELKQKLLRVQGQVSLEEIALMINNIRAYLTQQDYKLRTNQYYIGMKQIFWGYIIIAWMGTDFSIAHIRQHNKMLIKLSIDYYLKCWKDQNTILHNLEE